MLWINVLGGAAILGSYAWGLSTHRGTSGVLWGGVPDALQPLYAYGMIPAVAGYFTFTHSLLLRLDPARSRYAQCLRGAREVDKTPNRQTWRYRQSGHQ